MVFSSDPVFQVLDPPILNHHPPGGSVSENNTNDDRNHHHLTLPPMPPSQGLSTGPNSMAAERPRLTKVLQQGTGHKCPRCTSTNTKFCYYNNYSLSQPRHFCKACRRYWTRGGALRNVPVGGGFRRNKKIKRSIRSKSPVTGNSSTSGVSSSSCTTNNILGHSAPSILPHFPLFPLLNFTTDLGTENMNSLPFRGIHSPTTMMPGEYSDQWRVQKFPVAAGLEPTSAGVMYQFPSEGLREATSQYGFKTTVESCGPSQIELIKFEEDQGFMSSQKNLLQFLGNEQQEYWNSVNAWNEPNALNPSTGHLL